MIESNNYCTMASPVPRQETEAHATAEDGPTPPGESTKTGEHGLECWCLRSGLSGFVHVVLFAELAHGGWFVDGFCERYVKFDTLKNQFCLRLLLKFYAGVNQRYEDNVSICAGYVRTWF